MINNGEQRASNKAKAADISLLILIFQQGNSAVLQHGIYESFWRYATHYGLERTIDTANG
jgi:hypothetical protein